MTHTNYYERFKSQEKRVDKLTGNTRYPPSSCPRPSRTVPCTGSQVGIECWQMWGYPWEMMQYHFDLPTEQVEKFKVTVTLIDLSWDMVLLYINRVKNLLVENDWSAETEFRWGDIIYIPRQLLVTLGRSKGVQSWECCCGLKLEKHGTRDEDHREMQLEVLHGCRAPSRLTVTSTNSLQWLTGFPKALGSGSKFILGW